MWSEAHAWLNLLRKSGNCMINEAYHRQEYMRKTIDCMLEYGCNLASMVKEKAPDYSAQTREIVCNCSSILLLTPGRSHAERKKIALA